jgi:hypothetical protein
MTVEMLAAALAGIIWGGCWALYLQTTTLGRYLANHMTWLTVVIGVGVDLAILLAVLPLDAWLAVLAVVGGSAIPIIGRSLVNMMRTMQDAVSVLGDRRHDD